MQIHVNCLVGNPHRAAAQFKWAAVLAERYFVVLEAARCMPRGRTGNVFRRRLSRLRPLNRELRAAGKRDTNHFLQWRRNSLRRSCKIEFLVPISPPRPADQETLENRYSRHHPSFSGHKSFAELMNLGIDLVRV